MNMYVEYYKKFKKTPSLEFKIETKNQLLQTSFDMPANRAIEYLKKRGENIITTSKWNAIDAQAQHKAFTVAGVMNADVLQEVFDYMQKAIKEGWSLNTFKKNVADGGLIEKMQDAGWTGKSPSRLRVIYDTNMKMAMARGRFDNLKMISDKYPYWIFKQVERKTKRHDHSLFHNKKFRHDDPIWSTIFPPSAFECACYIVPTKDSSGVENGNDYLDNLNDNNNFVLKPLRDYEPQMDKYAVGIKKELEKLLASNTPQLSNEYKKYFDNPQYTYKWLYRDIKATDIIKDSKIVFGKDLTANEIANISGAPNGSEIEIHISKRYKDATIKINHPEYKHYSRVYRKDSQGNVYCYNEIMEPHKPNNLPKGIGAMALFRQVQECSKYGINTIKTEAFRHSTNNEWTGYYVWFLYGFNSKVPSFFINVLKNKKFPKHVIKRIENGTMHDVMLDQDLRDIWSDEGRTTNAEFNTDPNSADYQMLLDYMKQKGIRK